MLGWFFSLFSIKKLDTLTDIQTLTCAGTFLTQSYPLSNTLSNTLDK